MNILLVVNKTLQNGEKKWDDGAYGNLYVPLKELGHNVYFYDTVDPEERDFDKIVDNFKPDLIYCCMTGDPSLTPHEPWEGIIKQTEKGNCKTFNWFCDDAWRFETFSSRVCSLFHVCSTPEVHYIEKFKEIGYNNILLGFWHTNADLYPKKNTKKLDISFCGMMNYDRKYYIDYLKNNNVDIKNFHGIPREEMLSLISESKLGINFSKNYNARPPVLQMKGRMVEIPAANALLFTEYAPGIENHFEIDKEIITFKTADEMLKKVNFLLKKPKLIEKITQNGYRRFIKDHDSKVRLASILESITSL